MARINELTAGLRGLLTGAIIFGVGAIAYSKKQYGTEKELARSEFTVKLNNTENYWSNNLNNAQHLWSNNLYSVLRTSDKLSATSSERAEKLKRLNADYYSLSANYAFARNELEKTQLENTSLSGKLVEGECAREHLREELNAIRQEALQKTNLTNNVSNPASMLNEPLMSTNLFFGTNSTIPASSTPHKNGFWQDLGQYRVHAENQGSRSSWQSLQMSGDHLGQAGNSFFSIATLSYGNSKFIGLREDDFRPKKFLKSWGESFVSLLERLGGPCSDGSAYTELNPLTGVITYPGRVIGGAAKLGENTANTGTFGLGNNVIVPALDAGVNLVESGKHAGQSAFNLTRLPVGNKAENAQKVIDWLGLVPLECASNVLEGEGFSNAESMQQAVREKGNFGVTIEFGGAGFLMYEATDGAFTRNRHKNGGSRIAGPGVK